MAIYHVRVSELDRVINYTTIKDAIDEMSQMHNSGKYSFSRFVLTDAVRDFSCHPSTRFSC